MYIEKGEIFGAWNTVWEYLYEEIKEPPQVTDKGLRIMLTVILKIKIYYNYYFFKLFSVYF